MLIRNAVVLSLTLTGILLLVVVEAERRLGVLGLGCFLLAWVYAVLTRDR